jgi:hypothetical protein
VIRSSRLLLAALLALAVAVAVPGAAGAAKAKPKSAPVPAVGIGEQDAAMFSDPNWQALGIKDVRVLVPWDVLHSDDWQRSELDAYMAAAHAAGARVLISLSRSRVTGRERVLPTTRRFVREFQALRARYPYVRDFITWNEANHCSQPTCRKPERVAAYFDAIRKHCRGCRIVGADVLDTTGMGRWVKRFRKATKARHLIWGLHNYVDANRIQKTGTKELLKLVKGDVWFTETGGLVWRLNAPSRIQFPESVPHAALATKQVFRLAALSPRVTRVYFYNWTPGPTWDSALTDAHGRPRPAYKVLKAWLRKHPRRG